MSRISKLSSFIASVATQVRAAIRVGFRNDDLETRARRYDGHVPTHGLSDDHGWNDAPGRMTRNGLGSLEIGAGKTQVDE